jgi:hypothetical protein
MNWSATARSIDHPIRTALCHILDGYGRIVTNQGKPVVVAREVSANTAGKAAEILSKSSLVFVKWWPWDAPTGTQDGGIEFENKTDDDVDVAPKRDANDQATTEVGKAVKWLREKLAQGERLSSTLIKEANEEGLSREVLLRAKNKLHVRVTEAGFGTKNRWFWALPPEKDYRSRVIQATSDFFAPPVNESHIGVNGEIAVLKQ